MPQNATKTPLSRLCIEGLLFMVHGNDYDGGLAKRFCPAAMPTPFIRSIRVI